MMIKNNGPGDSTLDAETRMTSPANCKGFILCLCELLCFRYKAHVISDFFLVIISTDDCYYLSAPSEFLLLLLVSMISYLL